MLAVSKLIKYTQIYTHSIFYSTFLHHERL